MADNGTGTVIGAAVGAVVVGGALGYAVAQWTSNCMRIRLPHNNADCVNHPPAGAQVMWDSGVCWVWQIQNGFDCYAGQTRSCMPSTPPGTGGAGGTAGGMPLCTGAGGNCGVQYCTVTPFSATWETACHATTR